MTDVAAAMPASPERMPVIRSVAILGAGTMGAQIAAHFANAGVPSLLLDLTADAARDGLERARTLKPDPFFTPRQRRTHPTGGFDADLAAIAEADWVIEAVVEQLDVKRDAARARRRRPAAGRDRQLEHVGHPDCALAEGRSEDFRRHWLGTHFFNPPRYLHLLEVDPDARHGPGRRATLSAAFADHRLGKGVVIAKDTPGFIANHIGLYGVMRVLEALESRRATRSKRSMRSPARRSAGRRARRSGPWTSPGSTCWRTSRATCTNGCREATADAVRVPPLVADARARDWSARRAARASTSEKNGGRRSRS